MPSAAALRRRVCRGARAVVVLMAAAGSSIAATEHPSSAMPLSFGEAITLAGRRYVDVLVANERAAQALARLSQARSVLWPQVTASASQARGTTNLDALGLNQPGGQSLVGPFNTFDARVKLTQTVFDAGALQRLAAARAGRQLSLAQYEQAKQDAMALVAALFLEAVRAAQSLEPAQAVLHREQQRVTVLATQYQIGTASSLQVRQAQADEAEARARWQAATSESLERQLDLIAALRLPMDQPLVLLDDDEALGVDAPGSSAQARAVAEHPEVLVAQRLLMQYRAEHAAELADAIPTVTASVNYGASGKQPGDAEGTYGVGAQVSMPLLTGGRRVARVREAGSRAREGQATLDDARHRVEATLLSAAEALQQSAAAVAAKTTELKLAATETTLAEERLRLGIGTELDLLEARTRAALAKDQRADAIATLRMAQVTLAHAMGHVEALAGKSDG